MRVVLCFGLVAALACAPAAFADKKPRPTKVMSLDFPPTPELSAGAIQALSETLAVRLRELGYAVLTPSDITAVLGVERQKQLLGCGDSSCFAELGGAMGVDYICRGTVSVLDEDSIVSISLIDPKGTALNQVRTHVGGKSSSAMVKALEDLVPTLVAPLRPSAAAPALAAPSRPTAALALMIAGGAVALGGAGVGGYALSEQTNWQSQLDGDLSVGDASGASGIRSKARGFAIGSGAALGVGLVALGAGAAWYFLAGAPAGGSAP